MERVYTNSLEEGKKATVLGWVSKVRDIGGLKFILIRDRDGFIQVTIKESEAPKAVLKAAAGLVREDCVAVNGTVKATKQAPGGKELIPEGIQVISKARTPLPIDIEGKIQSGVDKRFDYRFMDIRNPKVQAVFKVRDCALRHLRDFFSGSGFIETNTPVIQAAGAEGGSTLFQMIYYKNEASLRQSPQLYKQMLMASGMDRVYEIGPAFRAEKFHTRRHVSEFLSVDFEMAWIDSMEDVLKTVEDMVVHTIKGVMKDCRPELSLLEVKDLKVPETPFKRITYSDGVDILNKSGKKFEWGEEMMDIEEKIIGDHMAKKGHVWYFVTRFPGKLKPFYIMMDGKESHSYDCIFKGMEMASGGQREHRHDFLVKVMKEKGLDPSKFKFYLDAFQYGMPVHGGCGYGIERMVQQMLGLENIKEVILFPRTPERLVP